MTNDAMRRCSIFRGLLVCFICGCCSAIANSQVAIKSDSQSNPALLTLPAALHFALENNLALAAQRQQLGIASARIIIADTYPFNPVLENRILASSGPSSAGITNRVPVEHLLLWEVEVRNQRHFRREGAAATFSRTEWEIAFQEQTLSVEVIRAFTNVLYRQEKLLNLEETLRINERFVDDIRRLVNLGKLRSADLIQAPTEVTVSLDLVATGRESLAAARQDLNRVLGAVAGNYLAEGVLLSTPWKWESDALLELAIVRRADLKARQMAVSEASANVKLTTANRYGNPSVGAIYTYDPSRISSVGVQINIPLPIVNKRRGEIGQSEAERMLALAQLHNAEFDVKQQVTAALARLVAAERRAEQFRIKGLPDLRRAVDDMEKLFQAGESGVDLQRVIDVRRKLLQARDSYLDALWSVRQARIDVIAATGEPALELEKPTSTPAPATTNRVRP